jgi:SAM-dependent methyltransferase
MGNVYSSSRDAPQKKKIDDIIVKWTPVKLDNPVYLKESILDCSKGKPGVVDWAPGLQLFIDFVGVAANERILDVGCGTGSLTFALPRAADLGEIVAIDYSPVFVEETIRRNTDPRIKVRQADACALPFEGGTFDRALALLVLHFVPEAGNAVAEMRRVVRSGGAVAAAVWDHLGGMPGIRMIGRHRGSTQRRRAPAARPLLLPADDATGRNKADFCRAGSRGH